MPSLSAAVFICVNNAVNRSVNESSILIEGFLFIPHFLYPFVHFYKNFSFFCFFFCKIYTSCYFSTYIFIV